MRAVAIALVLAGCGSTYDDVVGPFTGPTHRYTLDMIKLPSFQTNARDWGADLDGNGIIDIQLGSVIASLAAEDDATTHAADMIAGGQVPTAITIVADDLLNDPTVGVSYFGTPDAPFVVIGGRLVDGAFRSNLTAHSAVPGAADLVLPVFADADPSVVHAIGVELELNPDGSGGFNAEVHAAIPTNADFTAAVHRGLTQMIASDPGAHRGLLWLVDTSPRDGEVSLDEVSGGFLGSLLSADAELDGVPVLGLGFRAHFRPCDEGACLDGLPIDQCFDRRRDGDETDLDCGGSCKQCQADATCALAADCATTTCEQGRCGPPSCTNGVRDGLESDIDCGAGCPGCALGQRCWFHDDCASKQCGSADDVDYGLSPHACMPWQP